MAVGKCWNRGMEVAMLGKKFLNHILLPKISPLSSISSPSLFRRAMHDSVYDKNVEEEVTSTTMTSPRGKVAPPQPEEYWAPDPETGVFVPASEQNHQPEGENGNNNHCGGALSTAAEGSILEEKAFFRPLEDLEPPPPHPFTEEAPPHHFTEELPSYAAESELDQDQRTA